MMKIIDFAKDLKCPSMDGIIFSDGTIQLLKVNIDWSSPTKYAIENDIKTSINTLQEEKELQWSDCGVLNSYSNREYKVLVGEGDYGSDGFVAIINLKSEELVWIAYLNNSNPFENAHISDGFIFAKTSLNCLWKFEIKNPENVIVRCH